MGTEETLGGFAVDQFIPPLIQLLNMDYNPEMMLLACRAIANMTEALPNSVHIIIASGAIPVICSKLMSIEYIDLAEQGLNPFCSGCWGLPSNFLVTIALTTLEKLSHDHPGPILRAGGLVAVLSFLDFFATGVQRSAVTTAANVCRGVPQDCFHFTVDAIPILTNLLRYQDHKIIEKACLAFSRLVDSFAKNSVHLKTIASHGMLSNMVFLSFPSVRSLCSSLSLYLTFLHSPGIFDFFGKFCPCESREFHNDCEAPLCSLPAMPFPGN